jgi:hypothetical protein
MPANCDPVAFTLGEREVCDRASSAPVTHLFSITGPSSTRIPITGAATMTAARNIL